MVHAWCIHGARAYKVHAWCRRLCKRLVDAGGQMGWNKHKVGAWSLRKDACEVVASTGQGEVAARVLGHRNVNSRTMERVYRADLRRKDLGAFWTGREAVVIGAPLQCLSARRVPKAGGVRSFNDVPEGAEREAAAASVEVAQAVEVAAETRRLLEARVGGAGILDIGRLARGSAGRWKKQARDLGAAEEVVAHVKALERKKAAQAAAKKEAMDAYQLRVYKEGQAAHAENRALAVAMRATHAWTERTEDEAIALGLDGGDRTFELAALRTLSPALQGSILAVGALHVLPSRPMWVGTRGRAGSSARLSSSRIHEHVAKQCEGCCRLKCTSECCEGVPGGGEVPTTVSAFEAALECERCGSETALCWWIEAPADARHMPLAVGAAAALGPSFAESYPVWYTMRGRATIGNAAYDAGASITRMIPLVAELLAVRAARGGRDVTMRPSSGGAATVVRAVVRAVPAAGTVGRGHSAAARPSGGGAATVVGAVVSGRVGSARPSGTAMGAAVGAAGGGRGCVAARPSGGSAAMLPTTAVGAVGGAARLSGGSAATAVGAVGCRRGGGAATASVVAQARCRGSAVAGADAFQTPSVSRESSGERSASDNGCDAGAAGFNDFNEYVEAASLPVWSLLVGVPCMRAVCMHVVQELHHRLPEAQRTAWLPIPQGSTLQRVRAYDLESESRGENHGSWVGLGEPMLVFTGGYPTVEVAS